MCGPNLKDRVWPVHGTGGCELRVDGLLFTTSGDDGRKRLRFKALIVIEILLICLCAAQYIRPLRTYTYQGQELAANACCYMPYGNFDVGCYIDMDIISEAAIEPQYVYVTTPSVNLSGGSYQVAIDYSTDDPNHKCVYTSKYRTYPVVAGHSGNRISMRTERVEFALFSPIPVEEFQVHIDYSGNGYLFVQGITIYETYAWRNIWLFFVLLFSAVIDGLVYYYRKIPEECRRGARLKWFAAISLVLFTSAPLMSFFMLDGDDLIVHLNRIEAIKTSLLAGQFPNRVSTYWNNGYGYASAVLYGEVFLYVPALLRILGFSVQGAYKIYVVLINLATMLVSYYSFKKVFRDEWSAMIGSAIYMLAPYRLVCLYLRAAVGEYTAMLFFPLIFCGLMQIYRGDGKRTDDRKSVILLIIGFTGVLQSHVISCLIVAGFMGLFCLLFFRKTFSSGRLVQIIKAVVWTGLLNLWFLVPFLDYMRMGYAGGNREELPLGRMNAHGAFWSQMLTLFQDSTACSYTVMENFGKTNDRNYALGGFLVAVLFYLVYRLYHGREKKRSELTIMGDCSLAFAAVAVFMCSLWFPWDLIQQMNWVFRTITVNIQFPWRLMGIAGFFLSVTTICLCKLLREREDRRLYHAALLVLGLCFVLSADYCMYRYTQEMIVYYYDDVQKLDSEGIGGAEYLPEGTPASFADDTGSLPGEGLEVLKEHNTGDGRAVTCRNTADADTFLDIPLLPYQGYVCRDVQTGEKLALELSAVPGRIRITVPEGYEGTFRVRFEGFWYWRVSEAVSLLSLLIAMAGMLFRRRKILLGKENL